MLWWKPCWNEGKGSTCWHTCELQDPWRSIWKPRLLQMWLVYLHSHSWNLGCDFSNSVIGKLRRDHQGSIYQTLSQGSASASSEPQSPARRANETRLLSQDSRKSRKPAFRLLQVLNTTQCMWTMSIKHCVLGLIWKYISVKAERM